MRDVKREVSVHSRRPQGMSTSIALQLLGHLTSPSQAALREEQSRQLENILAQLSSNDQEILQLRHFEELTNKEVAEVLDIQEKAASIRYVRALKRLKDAINNATASYDHLHEFSDKSTQSDDSTSS